MFKWIIIGGGIQSVTMASFLLKEKKASIRELAIVDPHQKPLQNWKRCTEFISILYLCTGLYVTGALAELEAGTIARNTSGARQAAERIIQSL
ncbi:hypothetical protein M3221_13015 [Domibacillus indicus]|uniref:hypothetical protein n=1 Tax=Domibacillus indicus TaxID=1437523 RepID=UPI002040AD89|nr:hypothetical protein [Domibacillus indicus]MCM3789320.1 hypothetical protein [Domibacillus indicus]